jgi:hypothetical protein
MKEKEKQKDFKDKNIQERIALGFGYIRGYKRKMDNTPKVEAKAEYREHKAIRSYRYNNLVVVVLGLAVIFVVIMLIYALYLFLHASRLTDLAGVHVTDNAKEAAIQLMDNGKITGNQEAGYENWLTFRGGDFEFKHPGDWELKQDDTVTVRKFNRQSYGHFDSLAAVVTFREIDNSENLSLTEAVKDEIKLAVKPIAGEIDGRKTLRTGKIVLNSGLITEKMYWQLDGKILSTEAVYYRQDMPDLEETFEKIIASVKFL